MVDKDVVGRIEALAEQFVLVEPSDFQALAQLHSEFENSAQALREFGFPQSGCAAGSCATWLERIILQEVSDAVAVMDAIAGTLAEIQSVLRDGRDENDAGLGESLEALTQTPQAGQDKTPDEPRAEIPALPPPSVIDDAIFAEFLSRQDSVLDELEELVLAMEHLGEEPLPAIRGLIHTMKGETAMLGLNEIEHLCHSVEDILDMRPVEKLVEPLFAFKDWLKRAMDFYMGRVSAPPMPVAVEACLAELRGVAPQAASADTPDSRPREGKPLTADLDLLKDFCVEANEHLENSDVQLLTLETNPTDADALNAVFRAFHTIKGVAGFMALEDVQALAHEAEFLLDHARKGELVLQGRAIDVTFDAVDGLKRLIADVAATLNSGGLLPVQEDVPKLVAAIRSAARGEPGEAKSLKPDSRPLGDILVDNGVATEASIARALHIQETAPAMKKIGEILVEASVASAKDIAKALEKQKTAEPDKRLGEILVEMGAASAGEIDQALHKQARCEAPRLGELLVRSGEVRAPEVAQALRAQKEARESTGGGVQVREAVKVDGDRLDLLINMIGELVIAQSMVSQSSEVRALASTEVGRQVGQLDKITRDLQEMATSLRMVPVRATFQKMARLVRDLAKKTDKQVEFRISGEETELDKSVVDKMGDPLVHMIRNAVDHGIEASAKDRVAAGKAAVGVIHLSAFHKGGNIHMVLSDDGRGLDRNKLIAKAVDRGIVPSGDGMSDREVFNLIFEPGFSTAEKLTEVSGRGVGMDVVKRNIEALRGEVEIQSVLGKGTTFTLKLPLTLAIIDGMVVRAGQERYVFPTLSIILALRPQPGTIETVFGRGEMFRLRDALIPLLRLHRLYNVGAAETRPEDGIIMVVEIDGRQTGILVDEILGQQQIVIKSLGESIQGVPGIAGGAILPDGRVGLILDVGGLVRIASSD